MTYVLFLRIFCRMRSDFSLLFYIINPEKQHEQEVLKPYFDI